MQDFIPIVGVDFDGVIHSYVSGWQGPDLIPDPPVSGAKSFLSGLINAQNVQVVICSTRFASPFGAGAVARYLLERVEIGPEAIDWKSVLDLDEGNYDWIRHHMVEAEQRKQGVSKPIRFQLEKPPAKVFIDDRAYRFEGVFPALTEILAFEPWMPGPEAVADTSDPATIIDEALAFEKRVVSANKN